MKSPCFDAPNASSTSSSAVVFRTKPRPVHHDAAHGDAFRDAPQGLSELVVAHGGEGRQQHHDHAAGRQQVGVAQLQHVQATADLMGFLEEGRTVKRGKNPKIYVVFIYIYIYTYIYIYVYRERER